MEEAEHKIQVLEGAKQALSGKDSYALRGLSDQTIHCASTYQDNGSIITAVLIYALSKLVERKDFERIKNWDKLVEKLLYLFTEAIKAAMQEDEDKYEENMKIARETLESSSVDLKHYIQEVLNKASINKASKMYEHGISLGQTAKLLGLTNWELTEYTGQSKIVESRYNKTINIKTRAKMALDFFS